MISSPPPGSGISFFPGVQKKNAGPNTWTTKRWSTSRLFKSFRGALKLSLFFLSIKNATNPSPPKSSSHRRPYISCSFHHFKIWTKHLIEKCKAYRKTMQKRKYVGLLEYWRKTHEKTSSVFFFVWPPVLRVLRKLHSTDFARFSIPGAGFAMRANGQTHGPMAFLCLLGCLDVCLSHGGIIFDKKNLGAPLFLVYGGFQK